MKPRIYLAGPIKGLNFDEATTWRINAIRMLADIGIDGMSPMRGKEYLKKELDIGDSKKLRDRYDNYPLSTAKAIMCRDFKDCTKSDAIIMYLLGAKTVSIGSTMEVAWGFHARVPIILVMEKEGNPHEHSMITEAINFRVDNLEEAVYVAARLILP